MLSKHLDVPKLLKDAPLDELHTRRAMILSHSFEEDSVNSLLFVDSFSQTLRRQFIVIVGASVQERQTTSLLRRLIPVSYENLNPNWQTQPRMGGDSSGMELFLSSSWKKKMKKKTNPSFFPFPKPGFIHNQTLTRSHFWSSIGLGGKKV